MRIKAVIPNISETALQRAVAFAVNAMQQTRDAYREPVALQEVLLLEERQLRFTVRALYTQNTSTYLMDCKSQLPSVADAAV